MISPRGNCSVSLIYSISNLQLFSSLIRFIANSVSQNIAVTSVTVVHIQDSLVSIRHRTLLDPRLDTLISSKLKHLPDLTRATNQRTTQLDALDNQSESRDLKTTIFRSTQLDESTTEAKQTTVLDDGHLGRRGSGDD